MINENARCKSSLYKSGFVLFCVISVCFLCLMRSYKTINEEYSKIVLISESELQNTNYPTEDLNDIKNNLNNAFMNAVEVNSIYTGENCDLELV